MKKILFLFSILTTLSNCSNNNKDKEIEFTDKELYKLGTDSILERKYNKSLEYFDKIGMEYPYSELAANSMVMGAYSYYKAKKYDHAIGSLDQYIKLFPSEKSLAYAYYLRALCYYSQIGSVEIDQKSTLESYKAFEELINKFPGSKYSKDAESKLDFVRDRLAAKEMDVAFFYLKNHQIIAAASRYQGVIDNYQNTVHVQEALYRMVECFYLLGLKEEAKKSASILGHNYPNSNWYKASLDLIKNGNA